MNRFYALLAAYAAGVVLFLSLSATGGTADTSQQKILRLAIDTEPATLDPISITDTLSDGVASKVYNQLVGIQKQGDKLIVAPDLAERWEVSTDAMTYTFHLRRGIQFHNGREVTAEDFVYSFRRLLSPRSRRSELLSKVVGAEELEKDPNTTARLGITALDPLTLKIELKQPFAPFIQHLCTVNCAVVPREAIEGSDDAARQFARMPIGTGPFKVAERRTYQVVRLTRNDNYIHGKPKLDAIHFYIIKDKNIQLEQFLAGHLDASSIPFGKMAMAREKAGEENVLTYSTMRTNYIGIGFPNGDFAAKEPLHQLGKHKLLRQAMNYALNREYLCDTLLEGRGVPAKAILPPGMPAYKEGRPGWPRNVAKAKALMAEAGFPGGKGLTTMTLYYRNDEDTRKMAQAIVHDMEEVGFSIELQAREWKSFLEMTENEPRQLFLLGWVADYPDPDNFLQVLFHSKQWGSKGNRSWYGNAEVDDLTDKAQLETDMALRAQHYQRAEDIILEECPWIPTYHARQVVLLSKRVKGIRENVTPMDTGTEFPQVDFSKVDIGD